MAAHHILLFDIDGTLVSTGGAGAVAWRRAFEELYGVPAVMGRHPTPHELAQLVQRRLGDTPLDIEAAHAVGCTAIGVATGKFDAAALGAAGADHVLETLESELPLA